MTWYKDSKLKEHIESLIVESYNYKKDFEKASNPARAQLWVVVSILAKRIAELEKELNSLRSRIEKTKKTSKKKK